MLVLRKTCRRKRGSKRRALNRANKLGYKYDETKSHSPYDEEPIAPSSFKLSTNENGVLKYIAKLERYLNKEKTVFVRLNNITEIDQEAVVLLLGIMAEFKSSGIRFNGNFPKNPKSKRILTESGFFKQLYPNNIEHSFGSKQAIYTHGQKVYDEESSCEKLSEAMTCVFGEKRRSQGARRVLLEAMKNTIAHASSSTDKRNWWLSFNKDSVNKKLVVSMLDYGVGIFKSLGIESPDNPGYSWYEKNINLGFSNKKLLSKIMNGDLNVSRTRESKHGTGLPGMKSALKNSFISKLVIISNDVFADISNNQYRTIDTSFSGTLIQFEICENCKSFPYE